MKLVTRLVLAYIIISLGDLLFAQPSEASETTANFPVDGNRGNDQKLNKLLSDVEALRAMPLSENDKIIPLLKDNLIQLTPPFVFELSRRTFSSNPEEAVTLYWLAYFRATYDVSRCTNPNLTGKIRALSATAMNVAKFVHNNPGKSAQGVFSALKLEKMLPIDSSPLWICLPENEIGHEKNYQTEGLIVHPSKWKGVHAELMLKYLLHAITSMKVPSPSDEAYMQQFETIFSWKGTKDEDAWFGSETNTLNIYGRGLTLPKEKVRAIGRNKETSDVNSVVLSVWNKDIGLTKGVLEEELFNRMTEVGQNIFIERDQKTFNTIIGFLRAGARPSPIDGLDWLRSPDLPRIRHKGMSIEVGPSYGRLSPKFTYLIPNDDSINDFYIECNGSPAESANLTCSATTSFDGDIIMSHGLYPSLLPLWKDYYAYAQVLGHELTR